MSLPHTSSPNTNRTPPSTTTHHQENDSQKLLPETSSPRPDPLAKTYAPITPHRLRSQLLVSNLKASGILRYRADDADSDDVMDRPPQLKHSARGLEAIGFDENASMYSSFKGEGGAGWGDGKGGGKEKKSKRGFLKRLVGKGEVKGEKL